MTLKNELYFLTSVKNQLILGSKIKGDFYDEETIEKIRIIDEKISYLNSLLSDGISNNPIVRTMHK